MFERLKISNWILSERIISNRFFFLIDNLGEKNSNNLNYNLLTILFSDCDIIKLIIISKINQNSDTMMRL